MCCSKLSVRIKTHIEGKRIDDEGNHTSQETCVCLSERRSNKETLVIRYRDADSFNTEHSGVFELHFKAEDFEANYAPRTSTTRVWMRLKPIAVPSVFVKYMWYRKLTWDFRWVTEFFQLPT